MGKKDKKKGKGAEKTAAKTEKKLHQKLKKELASKGEEDIESLLARFAEDDKKKNSVVEDLSPPPSKRSSFSLTAHPDKDQLLLFGGEYFNGNKTLVYNDFYFYNIKQNRWIKLSCPGGPPPRSSHQAAAFSRSGGQLWIFGGEFTSPTQSQFYHYKDLWLFSFSSKKWEKITGHGSGPCSRSGHRMVGLKNQLIIFGGFQDNSKVYKYFNDVFLFNLETYTWSKIEPLGVSGPCPRSGCQMLPFTDGRVLIYGGYSKDKVKKDVEKGVIHSDMFVLAPDKRDVSGLKWKWISTKQNGAIPSPRCAFSMCSSAVDKAVLFGGVYDNESEEELSGLFYDDLYQLDLVKMRWFELEVTGKKDEAEHEKRRRRKIKDNEDHDEEVNDGIDEMKLEEEQKVVSEDGVFTLTVSASSQETSMNTEGGAAKETQTKDVFTPPPRINPGLAVKKGVLYMYGGMYEEGDKQLTLNDFYSIDLDKLEEWNIIINLNEKDLEWFDSDSESDADDDDADVEDDDESEDDENVEDDEGSSRESAEDQMDTN